MLRWQDLPKEQDVRLPAEFLDGEGYFDDIVRSPSGEVRIGVFNAGRNFHPGFIIAYDVDGHPLCYVPCDPDVWHVAEDGKSMAFRDHETVSVCHLLVDPIELRTFPRDGDEFVTAVGNMSEEAQASIDVRKYCVSAGWSEGTLRQILSKPGASRTVRFGCSRCSFSQGIRYGGSPSEFSAFKFAGCPNCRSVKQVEVDVRSISAPRCTCGGEMSVYDDLHCEWEVVRERGMECHAKRFKCPSCGADELRIGMRDTAPTQEASPK